MIGRLKLSRCLIQTTPSRTVIVNTTKVETETDSTIPLPATTGKTTAKENIFDKNREPKIRTKKYSYESNNFFF